ncbi:MAG: MgtC/SapB family protein [Candidatus Micrarchaeota archaeon]|nr:MgtC/SapB family protein [Candidatus Micrarchaeota archaeon]
MLEIAVPPTLLSFGLYLLLSLVFGYIVGAERESRGKAAGISTQCLVIAGSMTFCFLSAIMEPNAPTRIASNVVTGIGFLGAGIIFHHAITHKTAEKVVNLTTAATIWVSAAIGMTLGFGYPLLSVMLVVFSLLALHVPHYLPSRPASR